ncbi:bifunctional riboflavin kinase/FAD synthetase [Zhouia sp. PK063]|uniref:bifunctional riboflavin kinase/FAD synthetase n=1 Tax=Zhouia sp. PK063 TaxID=3373602 RepID=UPI0037AD9C0D
MIVVRDLSALEKVNYAVVTIGTFDGVHIGHKKIIDRLITSAKTNNLKSTILTFFPHPRMVLQQDADLKLLNTLEEKINILKQTGLDQLIIHPFTKEFSRLTATEYVADILVKQLQAKKVIIGYDHRFGRNRTATIEDLVEFGETYNFEVEEISAQEVDEVSVSSTKIRKALSDGDILTANAYLGYPYMLTGVVSKGKGLGRQIEYPTANIAIEETYKLIPKDGVYVVKSKLDGKIVFGMMSIGFNPTVGGTHKTIEANFFDFNQDLYGKKIQVDILQRLRNEEKYPSVEVLKQQLAKDKIASLDFIKNHYVE